MRDKLAQTAYSVERAWLKRTGRNTVFDKRGSVKEKQEFTGSRRWGFYRTKRWLRLRAKVLETYGAVCMRCGITDKESKINVDHIKPRSLHPKLEYCFDNLQVLCGTCNKQKSSVDCTDYRNIRSLDQLLGIRRVILRKAKI